MTEENEKKLTELQDRLNSIGVSRIKIEFDLDDVRKLTQDKLCSSVCNVINAYLDDNKVKLEMFGDSISYSMNVQIQIPSKNDK